MSAYVDYHCTRIGNEQQYEKVFFTFCALTWDYITTHPRVARTIPSAFIRDELFIFSSPLCAQTAAVCMNMGFRLPIDEKTGYRLKPDLFTLDMVLCSPNRVSFCEELFITPLQSDAAIVDTLLAKRATEMVIPLDNIVCLLKYDIFWKAISESTIRILILELIRHNEAGLAGLDVIVKSAVFAPPENGTAWLYNVLPQCTASKLPSMSTSNHGFMLKFLQSSLLATTMNPARKLLMAMQHCYYSLQYGGGRDVVAFAEEFALFNGGVVVNSECFKGYKAIAKHNPTVCADTIEITGPGYPVKEQDETSTKDDKNIRAKLPWFHKTPMARNEPVTYDGTGKRKLQTVLYDNETHVALMLLLGTGNKHTEFIVANLLRAFKILIPLPMATELLLTSLRYRFIFLVCSQKMLSARFPPYQGSSFVVLCAQNFTPKCNTLPGERTAYMELLQVMLYRLIRVAYLYHDNQDVVNSVKYALLSSMIALSANLDILGFFTIHTACTCPIFIKETGIDIRPTLGTYGITLGSIVEHDVFVEWHKTVTENVLQLMKKEPSQGSMDFWTVKDMPPFAPCLTLDSFCKDVFNPTPTSTTTSPPPPQV